MANDKQTRCKATMLVGAFCKKAKCKDFSEIILNGEILRECRKIGDQCQQLCGGCEFCGDYSNFESLTIHHLNFDGDQVDGTHRSGFYGRIIHGKRTVSDLIALCKDCHNDAFVLGYLHETFSSKMNLETNLNTNSSLFERIGLRSSSFLNFNSRWQGTTFIRFSNSESKQYFLEYVKSRQLIDSEDI